MPGIFQSGKLDLSRDFLGVQNNPKIRDSYIICCFLEIFMAWKFVIGFFGGFFVVLFEALRICLGFDFCPHSIIRSSLSSPPHLVSVIGIIPIR